MGFEVGAGEEAAPPKTQSYQRGMQLAVGVIQSQRVDIMRGMNVTWTGMAADLCHYQLASGRQCCPLGPVNKRRGSSCPNPLPLSPRSQNKTSGTRTLKDPHDLVPSSVSHLVPSSPLLPCYSSHTGFEQARYTLALGLLLKTVPAWTTVPPSIMGSYTFLSLDFAQM